MLDPMAYVNQAVAEAEAERLALEAAREDPFYEDGDHPEHCACPMCRADR